MKKLANKVVLEKLKEAVLSILPIFVLVMFLGLTVAKLSVLDFIVFTIASVMLIIGLFLFTNGAENSIFVMGNSIGSELSKQRRFFNFIFSSIILGVIITIAEPDLIIFANQIASINNWVFIIAVGVGTGFFITVAVLRIIFQVKLRYIFLISYLLVLILIAFAPNDFVSVAFDASGLTTGSISSPFILAFGLGIASVRSGKSAQEDSFGLIGIASIGSILFVLVLSLLIPDAKIIANTVDIANGVGNNFSEIWNNILNSSVQFLFNTGIVILAITLVFFAYNRKMLKLPKNKIKKIIMGLILTYIGIVIYLVGVTVGYYPISGIIGYGVANTGTWLVVLLLLVIGFSIVIAEPAVHVLINKVYELTEGTISKKVMFVAIAISMSFAMLLAFLQIVFEIPFVYIVVPLYVLILISSLFAPQIFTAIAFDSGGVASGPMSNSFLLPLAMGIATVFNNGVTSNAFGTISLVSSTPLLTLQLLGIMFAIYRNKKLNKNKDRRIRKVKIEIVEFD